MTVPTITVPASRTGRRAQRASAVLGATAAATVGWAVAVLALGVDLHATTGGQTVSVGVGAVVAASLGAGVLGWAALALLERTTRRPLGRWTALAVLVTLASLGGPLSAGDAPASVVTLAGLHVLVAAVLIPALRRTSQAAA